MKKIPQSKRYTQIKQFKLVLEIENHPNFYEFMTNCLKNQKHLIHKLSHFQIVQRLQKFIRNHLVAQISIMEDWLSQNKQNKITEKMYNQSNERLAKLLQILKDLYKNENFQKDEDKNIDLYLNILKISDCFNVLQKLLSLLIQCMFEKIGSQFYDYIYFFINHIDIFNQKNTPIKQLYNLGTKIKKFQFYFIDNELNCERQIVCQDFYLFISTQKVWNLNYIQLTDFILNYFNIILKKDSMTYRALAMKVKIYKHSVSVDQGKFISNNADIIVRCVVNCNVIYGLIDLFVLGQQFTQISLVPNIFTLPPDYSQIIKQCLQIYLEPNSSKETHLTILKDLNEILESQQKNATIDIIGKFNQNSILIFKFLNYIKAILRNQQITALTHFFDSKTMEDNNFMEQILTTLKYQIASTNQLNSIAEGITEVIFMKKSSFQFSDKIIVDAGTILVQIEYDEEKFMKIILQKMQNDIQNAKPYLKVLNNIFSKKNLRHNQRRDLGYIARQSSESIILQNILPLIEAEKQNKIIRDSFLMNIILLVSNICEESPTLLQNISKTNSKLIPYLMAIIQQGIHIPQDCQSINDILNFLHHISLIDGPIRNQMQKGPLQKFICTILSDDRFCDAVNQSKSGSLVGNINRIITNIKTSNKFIFHGIIKATKILSEQYKTSNIQTILLSTNQKFIQIKESMLWRLYTSDCKLSNILRIVLKTHQLIVKKYDSVSLISYASLLVKLQMSRSSMFLDLPYQNTLLGYIIKLILNFAKQFNANKKQKEDRLKQLRQQSNQNYMEQQQPNLAQRVEDSNNLGEGERTIFMRGRQRNQNVQRQAQQLVENIDNEQQGQNIGNLVPASEIQNMIQFVSHFQEQIPQKIDIQQQKEDPQQVVNPIMPANNDTQKITWHHTVQKYNELTSVWENVKKRIYQTVLVLQKIVQRNQKRFQDLKQIDLIAKESISSIMQRIAVKSITNSSQPTQKFEIDILLLIINATKLQRYLSYIYKIVNFQNKNFDQTFYLEIVQKCSKILLPLIKLSVSSHAVAIEQFLNISKKFQQANRFPKYRTDNKQIDLEAMSKHIKMVDLNQKWGIYHSLLGILCKFATIGFFINIPFYIKSFNLNYLQPVKKYFLNSVIPKIRNQMSLIQLQSSRQIIHVITELFCVHDPRDFKALKIPQIQKIPINKIIGIYCFYQQNQQQNIFTVFSDYIAAMDKMNLEFQDSKQDTYQGRIKCVRKIFYKSCISKIKQFLQQTYNEQIQPQNQRLNQLHKILSQSHIFKTYYLYSKIYNKMCTFFQRTNNNSISETLSIQVTSFNSALISYLAKILTSNDKMDQYLIYFNCELSVQENEKFQKCIKSKAQLSNQIRVRTVKLDQWILNNSTLKLRFIPIIKRTLLNTQLSINDEGYANFKQQTIKTIINLSQNINRINFKIFGTQMNLGVSGLNKPKIDENQQINLADQIESFANYITHILEVIKFIRQKEWFNCGNPSISKNYIKAILNTTIMIIENFKIDEHAPQQTDKLVLTLFNLIQAFVIYKKQKQTFLEFQKKNRKKESKKQKKKLFKHLKMNKKIVQKENQSSHIQVNQSSDISKRPFSRQSKRSKIKQQNSLKHDKSRTSLLTLKTPEQHPKKINKKIKIKSQNHEFNKKCTDFFKIVYSSSQKNPFLTSATFQFSIQFIQKFSKDVIVKNQIDQKTEFYIYSGEIFSDLLKVRVTCSEFKGFFYDLSHLSMKLMSEKHIKIDIQAAIKRFFYEKNVKRVRLSIFSVFLKQNFIKMPELQYLLNLVYIKKDKNMRPKKKNRQQDVQKDQQVQIQEFTMKNIKKFSHESDDRVFVQLKNNEELNIISLPLNKKRKHSQVHNNQEQKIKKVKFYQYHPQGDLSALLCQIVNHVIKIAIKQIINSHQKQSQIIQQEKQKQSNKAMIFNLKSLLYTLQVIVRQSPILAPWIARFKCKKIIINQLKNQGITIKDSLFKKILLFIFTENKFNQYSEIPQISLLSILVQFIYPLCQISTFIFQLCLDNNILTQINQKPKEKQSQLQKKTVTFGSMVRKKVYEEIQDQFTKLQKIDKNIIQNGVNQNYLILKKVSIMGLLTVLCSIKQFGRLCIQNNLVHKIQKQFDRNYKIILKLLKKNNTNLSVTSSLMRNFIIPFFLKPLQILQQLSISYQIHKRKGKNGFASKPNIKVILTSQSINEQILQKDVFPKNKFKIQWPFMNFLDCDDLLEEQFQEMSEINENSSSDSDQDELRFLDNLSGEGIDIQNESQPGIPENIQQLNNQGQSLDQDPFQRDSNTFENHILGYPPGDDFINQHSQSQDSNLIDSYDDSQQGQNDQSDIQDDQISQQQQNDSFFSSSELPFGLSSYLDNQGFFQNKNIVRVSPVGIYQYYSPNPPTKRQHLGHNSCPKSSNREIQKLQNLYEAFMDIVAFQNIIITNQMVKLENQQAKLIRKIFKIISFANLSEQLKLNNKNIIKQEIFYHQQIMAVVSFDPMFKFAEHIDFEQCQRGLYSIQAIPQHFYNYFQSNPQYVFNLKPKLQKDRRRNGMFLNLSDLSGLRRPNIIHPNGQNPPILLRQQNDPQNQNHQVNGQPFEQNSQGQVQINSQEDIQEQQAMARLQLNINLPNGNINLNTDLSSILRNLGMNQTQFRNLPQQLQSDIITNSLMDGGQLQNIFNRVVNRNQPLIQGINPPAVSLASQSNNESEMQNQIDQHQQVINQNQDSHHIEEQNNQMQQQVSNQQILQNHESNSQSSDQIPEPYRKMSLDHTQKINKDVIELLNKDGKNNHKYLQTSDHHLQLIFQQIFIIQEKDFSKFPFGLLQSYMINTNSCSKILSSLVVLLNLHLENSQQRNSSIRDIEEVIKVPKRQMRIYFQQIIKDFDKKVYPIMALKCLSILQALTIIYSISIQTLEIPKQTIDCLKSYFNKFQQNYTISTMQNIIRLLKCPAIKQSSSLLTKVLNILNNIISHYFERNIHQYTQKKQQMKDSRKKIQAQNIKDKMDIEPIVNKQNFNQNDIVNSSHNQILLKQQSVELLCMLLQSDELKDNLLLSQIIMRLSINGKNLVNFMKYIENVLRALVQKSVKYLVKQVGINFQYDTQKIQDQQEIKCEIEDLNKVYSLVYIFYQMIKQFKTHSARYFPDKQQEILNQFKRIVSSPSIYKLCQIISDLILNESPKVVQFINQIPQLLECFFIIYSIAIQFTSKNLEKQKQKQTNKIASLGQINKINLQKLKNGKKEVVMLGPYNLSYLWEQKICSSAGRAYMNSCIKKKLTSFVKQKKQKKMSLFDIPMIKIIINTSHLLDFQNKRSLFRAELKRLKHKKNYPSIFMSLNRQEVFQQSFNQIMGRKGQQLKGKVKIDFINEEGQDAGGLTRQWYQLLSTQMFNPNYGLFKPSSTGNTYQPSSMSYVNTEHLQYFKFIGRIMGKALHDGFMLDAYFTPAFYKHILNLPITYLDMEQEDYQYFRSLKWILDNSPIQDYNLGFNFTYQFDNFGQTQIKQLIPNGAQIQVTQENKLQYVQLICYAKMATAVKMQLQNFLEGLHQLIPHRLLKIFDAKQLQIMISGLPTIDITDLKRNTDLVNYTKTDQIIIWLFQVLESFDMSLRTSFLQFVTGTSRVPPEGFKALNGFNGPQKFNIHKQFNKQFLPRAHTCFNQLDLPNYPTKQILIQKLTYAITEGKEGFGFL